MKKIFILSILIAPLTAMADDLVGPARIPKGETPVVATDLAPYETATINAEDSTTVVSASYVKGAYNDTIAAINRLDNSMAYLQNNLDSGLDDVFNALYDKRVSAVTTWGNDTPTQLTLTTASE